MCLKPRAGPKISLKISPLNKWLQPFNKPALNAVCHVIVSPTNSINQKN